MQGYALSSTGKHACCVLTVSINIKYFEHECQLMDSCCFAPKGGQQLGKFSEVD